MFNKLIITASLSMCSFSLQYVLSQCINLFSGSNPSYINIQVLPVVLIF